MVTTTEYWAEPPMRREQAVLFAPTLDDMIAPDDPVRLFDEVLAGRDWSEWEAEYDLTRGQPPIHPRHVAACLLYGMARGIRSSRKLEEACRYRVDFMWLLETRVIDHTTLCNSRTKFGPQLKGLFRQVCQVAMTLGLVRLGEVAFDGTRVKANNSRYKTRTAATLEEKLEALDTLFDEMLAEIARGDGATTEQVTTEQATTEQVTTEQVTQLAIEPTATEAEPPSASATRLPAELAELNERRRRVRDALEKARAADAARRKQGVDPVKNPAQVPTSDPDSCYVGQVLAFQPSSPTGKPVGVGGDRREVSKSSGSKRELRSSSTTQPRVASLRAHPG
jgi:transposase